MRVWIWVFIAVCTGCQPIYVVESSQRDFNNKIRGDRHYKTIGLYQLPRTDLRVDAAITVTETVYGKHYCFAKDLEMGAGDCPKLCKLDPTTTTALRAVEVTPVTLPDTSDVFAVRLRDKRRAVKRTSFVKTTPEGILAGAEATVVGAGKIAVAVAKGVADFVATALGATIAATPDDECSTKLDDAKRARVHYQKLRRCRNALKVMHANTLFPRWKNTAECSPVFSDPAIVNPTGSRASVAVAELDERLTKLAADFSRQETRTSYSVQEWVQVEPGATTPDSERLQSVILRPGKDESVGLCGPVTPNKTKEASAELEAAPPVRLCRHGEENMLVELYLTPPPATSSALPEIRQGLAYRATDERLGLVYRLPRTLLLHVDVRPEAISVSKPQTKGSAEQTVAKAGSQVATKGTKAELLARQVKEVTFAQMGPMLRIPNKLAGGNAKISVEASSKTGMLTKIEVSKEPAVSDEQVSAAMPTLVKAGELVAEREVPSSQLEDTEEENRQYKADWENECLRGIRDDCDKMWWTD